MQSPKFTDKHMPLVGLRMLPYTDQGRIKNKFPEGGGGGRSEHPTLKFNVQKEKKKKSNGGAIFS